MLAQLEEVVAAPLAASHEIPWAAVVLAAATILFVPAVVWMVQKIVPGDEETRVNWDFGHVGGVVLIGLCAAVAATVLRIFLAREERPSVNELLVASALATGAPALVAVATAHLAGPRGLFALGVRSGRLFRAPFAGLLAYFLVLPGFGALQVVWVWALTVGGLTTTEQPLIKLLAEIPEGGRLVAVVIGALIIPLVEEILFRGFLQPVLIQRLNVPLGIALTSALFAIMHGVESVAPIFALSCLLGYIMYRTQRLHAVWAIHAVHNGLQFLMLYVYPEFLERAVNPHILMP